MPDPTLVRLSVDMDAVRKDYETKSARLREFCEDMVIPMDAEVYDFDYLFLSCQQEYVIRKYWDLEVECVEAAIAANGKVLIDDRWLTQEDMEYYGSLCAPNEVVINDDDSIDMVIQDPTVAMMFKLRMGSLN